MSQKNLFSIAKFDFKLNHFLIILILSLSFTISFLLRSLPVEYGWELHEFDPFFNYRATEYILNNGILEYFDWNDSLSWYPNGRDISSNSQVMLHVTAAIFYSITGKLIDLYDFTILFPVVFGSLTSVIVFALVRRISGTTAGLFASLLFSISLPILVRGQLGWFKSEPLGLFFGLFSIYLFLSGIKSKNKKIGYSKLFFAGLLMTIGFSAWGGNLFFIMILGTFFCILPFIRKDHSFLLIGISIFTFSLVSSTLLFQRLGPGFISGLSGLSLIGTLFIMFSIIITQKFSQSKIKNRNGIFVLVTLILISGIILFYNEQLELISLPTHRYLNAILPILTTTNPLTDSVSEHATLQIQQSFQFHSIFMIFAGIGIWITFSQLKQIKSISLDMLVFSLVFGFIGVYMGSTFMRLEVFTSIGIIILASTGLSLLFNFILSSKNKSIKNNVQVLIFSSGIICLLIIPLFLPESGNVLFVAANTPPTILNGGTIFNIAYTDWRDSLEWIEKNTPKDSVVGSWWDYGYWIQTISNRPTLVDNATLIEHRIASIAKIFFESPNNSWIYLNDLEADYFIIFISGEKLPYTNQSGQSFYVLGGGGDESKKYWFAQIGKVPVEKFLENDSFSGKDLFWQETLLGNLIPFDLVGYVNFSTDEFSEKYVQGWTGVYHYKNKFLDSNSPFNLVYSSKSVTEINNGPFIGVFIYEINPNYKADASDVLPPLFGIDTTPDRFEECIMLLGDKAIWDEVTKSCTLPN